MYKGLYILIFLFSFFEAQISYAQDSEQVLNTEGLKLFDNEDFVSATPIYLQLLALKPRSPEYNFRYGACLLFNSIDRKSAIKYLEFATANEEVNPDAYYFMGKAFHLNYQFDKAISFYEKYHSKAKIKKSWEVERQIASCENGKKLLKNISEIVVFEKKSTLASFFYSAYNLSEIGGDIVVSDADQSKIDKKKSHRPLIYFPPNASRVFFGSYGDSETGGKNIYYKDKNSDGSWSKPVLVSGEVNSEFDEDYPFMDVKNGILYFSSKGHNSMGGYDIFKSKYNSETNTFGKPENLDFAISSTDNDLLYLLDDSGDFAWFASSRQSKDGKLDVYKVKQERVPAPIAAVKGNFNSIINPENKKVTIEVKELISKKIIGTYYTDDLGEYLITFPKNGKYEYKIQVFGTLKPFTEIVTIYADEQLSIFNQQMIHTEKDSQEKIEIIQLVKQDVSNNTELLAEVMKSKSELNPNSEILTATAVENSLEVETVLKQLGMGKRSLLEVSDQVQELIDFQKKELTKNEKLQQQAFQVITENNQKITTLQQKVKNTVAKTHGLVEDAEKKDLLDQAAKDIDRINQLDISNKELLLFADSIENLTANLLISSQTLKTFDANLMKAKNENESDVFNVISNNVALIQQVQSQVKDLKKNSIQAEIGSLTEQETKNAAMIASYERNLKTLKQDLSNLETAQAKAKGKKQAEIKLQVDAKMNEIGLIQNEVDKLEEKNNLLKQQIARKNTQLSLAQNINKQVISDKKLSITNVLSELKSADNPNFRTLKSYVAQQREKMDAIISEIAKAQLEKKDTQSVEDLETEVAFHEGLENSIESASWEKDSEQAEKKENQIISNHQENLAKIEANQELKTKEKGEAVLKLEIELQESLNKEIQEIQKSINENASNSNFEEKHKLLVQEKQASENRVAEQVQNLISNEISQVDSKKLLSKIDSNYQKDIQKIQNSKSDNKSLDFIEREQQVQLKLTERLTNNQAIANLSTNVELLAENQVIKLLIDESKNRVEAIQSEITVQNEMNSSSEYIAKESKFREELLGEHAEILSQDYKTAEELTKQQQIISKYLDALEINLSDLRTRMKENTSSDLSTDLDWIIQELESVEAKLIVISKDLSSIQSAEKNANETEVKEELLAKNPENLTVTNTQNAQVNDSLANPTKSAEIKSNEVLAENEPIVNNERNSTLASKEEDKWVDKQVNKEEVNKKVKSEETNVTEQVQPKEIQEITPISELTNETGKVDENLTAETEITIKKQHPQVVNEEKSSSESIQSIEKRNRENQLAISHLKSEATAFQKLQLADIERANENILAEISQISKLKEEVTKQKTLSKIEQEQLISQEKITEIEIAQGYEHMVESTSNTHNLKVLQLESTSQLETKLRRYSIEIGELTSKITQIENEIPKANKRKTKELNELLEQNKSLFHFTEIALLAIENEINERKAFALEVLNSTEALKQPITTDEEIQTAQGADYKLIHEEYEKIVALNAQIKATKSKIEFIQNDLELAMSVAQKNQDASSKTRLDEKLIEINTWYNKLSDLQEKRSNAQVSFDENIQKISNQDWVKNLLIRGIAPITKRETRNLEMVQFQILSTQTQRKSMVLIEEKPTGLIYRIQVGAFSKPINESLFSEFTPISGEKLNNGITRYMVGNFNKSVTVLDALEKVRKLGYKDAFPVAYCDGERITMFEAKRLEVAGLCVAQGENQMEIKENEFKKEEKIAAHDEQTNETKEEKQLVTTDENTTEIEFPKTKIENKPKVKTENPIDKTVSKQITKTELNAEDEKLAAYNKAPGAAVADAVETRLGLFFTVQIGVYNKPVPASQLQNIQPLITQRLDNGQVRYSTGIFHNVLAAKPKREEAILLGISDAYITAYYQGKRISIQEARALLAEKGETILEPINLLENQTLSEKELDQVVLKKIKEEKEYIDKKRVNVTNSKLKIQFISKKQHENFPIDVLKRYNQKGDFYYDSKDKRVKSLIYDAENLPSIYGFRDDVDTLVVKTKSRQEVEAELILKVEINQTTLPGNVGDWLLRLGHLRELKVLENRIQLTIFGITDSVDYAFLLADLRSLGFELVPTMKE